MADDEVVETADLGFDPMKKKKKKKVRIADDADTAATEEGVKPTGWEPNHAPPQF
jgi:hypothetical protein